MAGRGHVTGPGHVTNTDPNKEVRLFDLSIIRPQMILAFHKKNAACTYIRGDAQKYYEMYI